MSVFKKHNSILHSRRRAIRRDRSGDGGQKLLALATALTVFKALAALAAQIALASALVVLSEREVAIFAKLHVHITFK